ncbi:xanthine dehydrogenase subunit XdhA [Miniphocaeibacter massiliensis]|uniref:xanthine dehydrogenase subunit XdhA n=1 Tax=Miniphocaeibacter massiliensis TaxID=2041841 RepID=UPI000C08BE88|nr:xanthine dehydrogenase subunit XdhA [Miniphocaeibacter massiliensis]
MKNNVIGKPAERWDAIAKVKGQAKYTADYEFKHMLHGKIVRSTIAHGYVKEYDISEAELMPGVVKILLPEDVPQNKYGTAGHPLSLDPKKKDIEDRTLLTRKVHHYGDTIAAVIAKTELDAIKAIEKIKITYDEYPVYLTPQESMKEDAKLIHEEHGSNILADTTVGIGDIDKGFEEADYILEEEFSTPVQQHTHMEKQIATAYLDEDQRWTCISSTQIPHIARRIIGQALGMPWSKFRVKKPFIGGGFGNKQDVTIEPLAVYMSMLCNGKPVQISLSREESIGFTRTRHAIDYKFKVGVTKDGKITAMDCECISNQGGYASHGHAIAGKGSSFIEALYKIDNFRYNAKTVYTNIAVAGAMRGYGIPQVMYALESMIDDLALKVGMDPIEFRIKNKTPDGYHNKLSGVKQYGFKIEECLLAGKEKFKWNEKLEDSKKYKTGSKRRGVGVAGFSYGTAVYPFGLEVSGARLILIQDGNFKLMIGATEIGQGSDTVFSQMAAETIGVSKDNIIRDAITDTDVDPFDTGAYASRQSYITGYAVKEAAQKMRKKIIERTSAIYDIREEYIDIVDSKIVYKHNGEIICTMAELALKSFYDLKHGRPIVAESSVNIHNNSYASGCTYAQVEVDIETGRVKILDILNVHDSGKILNPTLAEGQVEGGMAMAIAYGLSEGLVYDKKGKPLNNNLLDYKMPTTMDLPDLDSLFVEEDDPLGPYGNKALGENPHCSPAPAIRNAVLNAVGVPINKIPLNTQMVFEHLKKANLI